MLHFHRLIIFSLYYQLPKHEKESKRNYWLINAWGSDDGKKQVEFLKGGRGRGIRENLASMVLQWEEEEVEFFQEGRGRPWYKLWHVKGHPHLG